MRMRQAWLAEPAGRARRPGLRRRRQQRRMLLCFRGRAKARRRRYPRDRGSRIRPDGLPVSCFRCRWRRRRGARGVRLGRPPESRRPGRRRCPVEVRRRRPRTSGPCSASSSSYLHGRDRSPADPALARNGRLSILRRPALDFYGIRFQWTDGSLAKRIYRRRSGRSRRPGQSDARAGGSRRDFRPPRSPPGEGRSWYPGRP